MHNFTGKIPVFQVVYRVAVPPDEWNRAERIFALGGIVQCLHLAAVKPYGLLHCKRDSRLDQLGGDRMHPVVRGKGKDEVRLHFM